LVLLYRTISFVFKSQQKNPNMLLLILIDNAFYRESQQA
jgi:hypothetical protein